MVRRALETDGLPRTPRVPPHGQPAVAWQGLPAVARWLGKAEGLARGIVPQHMELVFNPVDGTLAIVESGQYNESKM
ncbi:MAG: hypothetical protein ACP5XB_08595 [Isosphaeraceae bacterium]